MLEVLQSIDMAQDRMDCIHLPGQLSKKHLLQGRTDAGGQAQGRIRSYIKTEASRLEERDVASNGTCGSGSSAAPATPIADLSP